MLKINKNYQKLPKNYIFSQINDKIYDFKKKNPNAKILNLGIGDVTRPYSKKLLEVMQNALGEQGNQKTLKGYPPEVGYDFLKIAILKYYSKLKVEVNQDEIFVSNGIGCDITNILDIFDGCDVVIQNPTYPAYFDSNFLFGNNIILIDANLNNNFLPMPSMLKPKSYLIYICSPNNPTGATYNKCQLSKWVDFANKTKSVILFDSAYSCFVQDDSPKSIFQIDGAKTCAIEFASFSKSFGFTNLRCGYTVVPKNLQRQGVNINSMWNRRQCTFFNGVPYFVQKGAEYALSDDGQTEIQKNISYYKQNTKILKSCLTKIGLKFANTDNSPYVWAKCPSGYSSWQYFDYLLSLGVVCIPGCGFGDMGEGYVRFSGFAKRQDILLATKKPLTIL